MIRKIIISILSLLLYVSIILTTFLFVINKKINLNEITGKVLANYISDIDFKKKDLISDDLINNVGKYLISDKQDERKLSKEINEFTEKNNLNIDETKIKDALKNTKNYLNDNKYLKKVTKLIINYFNKSTILNILYALNIILIALIIGLSKTIYKGIKKVGRVGISSGILIFILSYLGLKFLKIPILMNLLEDSLDYLKIISYYEIGIGIACFISGFVLNFIFQNND